MSRKTHMLQRGYELIWREGRPEAALAGLPAEFEWVVPDHPEGSLRRGPEEVIEFFRDWRDWFDDLDIDWEIHDLDDERALVLVDMHGRGHASSTPVEWHFGQIWTFRDESFVRMEMYNDAEEARRVAGLA